MQVTTSLINIEYNYPIYTQYLYHIGSQKIYKSKPSQKQGNFIKNM